MGGGLTALGRGVEGGGGGGGGGGGEIQNPASERGRTGEEGWAGYGEERLTGALGAARRRGCGGLARRGLRCRRRQRPRPLCLRHRPPSTHSRATTPPLLLPPSPSLVDHRAIACLPPRRHRPCRPAAEPAASGTVAAAAAIPATRRSAPSPTPRAPPPSCARRVRRLWLPTDTQGRLNSPSALVEWKSGDGSYDDG
ncbi:hypothetical protein I4F81_008367 [Pyropia yezoensis]|uniref:Uncharacterized protein n=1 Tax=Pyropia yezoensis TaxID=2788 RepID=A0ACC3C6U0_PYRYE|nr:hypothetical protein I4F81_008367 [Neopyropia yezoensis]